MRNKTLDQIRLFAALLVIIIHVPLPGKVGWVFEVISRIAVPLFFMISGFYSVGKSKAQLMKSAKKTAILLLWSVGLYFLWTMLWAVLRRTVAERIAEYFSFRMLLETFVLNGGVLLGHLWFILALLYCYLVYAAFLRKTSARVRMGISVALLVCCFVLRELLKLNGVVNTVLYTRNFLFTGMPFFLLGGLINQIHEQLIALSVKVWVMLFAIGIVAAIAEKMFIGMCDLYIGTVMASVALFVIAQSSRVPTSGVLADMGHRYATDIYIFHPIIITILTMAASVLGFLYTDLFQWLRAAVVFALSIGLSWLKSKLIRKTYSKC